MRIFVGLGNPGLKYERNRHNAGFMAVDAIHRHNPCFRPWRKQFHSQTSEGNLGGEKLLLLKPATFMNESGLAVGEILRYFKVSADDVLVIYDDIDLQPGKFKFKSGGGHGGHNGLRSITAHIGENYHRFRLGVGHPGQKEKVNRHVLSDFSKSDLNWLDPLLDLIGKNAEMLANGRYSEFANKTHLQMNSGSRKGKSEKRSEVHAKTDSKSSPSKTGKSNVFGILGRIFR